jgi:hypothetical protein
MFESLKFNSIGKSCKIKSWTLKGFHTYYKFMLFVFLYNKDSLVNKVIVSIKAKKLRDFFQVWTSIKSNV